MSNVIDAAEYFSIKKEQDLPTLESIKDYIDYGDESDQICQHVMLDLIETLSVEYEFETQDLRFLDELAFLHLILQAIVDRQLDIDNPFIEEMNVAISNLKREHKKEV